MKATLITLVILLGMIGLCLMIAYVFRSTSEQTQKYVIAGLGLVAMFVVIRNIVVSHLEDQKIEL